MTHGDNVGFSRKRTLPLAVAIALDETRTLIDAFNQRELALLNERQHAASFWKSFLVGAGSSALVLAKRRSSDDRDRELISR